MLVYIIGVLVNDAINKCCNKINMECLRSAERECCDDGSTRAGTHRTHLSLSYIANK